eukprot:symbB.v1.2.000512.t2/scaffold31.1/size418471/8
MAFTFRWYGTHERFQMTTGWPEVATEVCQEFPAVCISLPLNRCVKAPEGMGAPFTMNTSTAETENFVYRPPLENADAGYMLLTWMEMNGQRYFHIYSGCSSTCAECATGKGLALTPVQLPSMCGTTDRLSVYGILYNPGDGTIDRGFNCVDSLEEYWAQALANDLFATIMRISISGLIVLVIITLGSFLYLRICRQESSPYGLSIGNRVQVATGTFVAESFNLSFLCYSCVSLCFLCTGGLEPPTKEQIEACVPEVRMDEEETCAVCLESIEVDQPARKLQCKHAFHSDCIINWCTHRAQQAIICPVCRDQQPLNATQHRQATTATFTADMGKSIPSPTQAEPQVIGSVEGNNSENV